MLKTSVLHVVMGAALAAGSAIPLADVAFARSNATPGASAGGNPMAVARGQLPNAPAAPRQQGPMQVAAACNPCGGRKKGCGACNPCAAKKKGCGACNPCAAKKGCSPCAAKACNPCAAKKGCNPCAAKACNPCAAKKGCGACNPCNPCGAGGATASMKCAIPRLVTAALCNPCAAKKKGCGACNPCAAKKACNPCAAKACNPCAAKKGCGACNPCAAKKKGCGACNPCAAKKACSPCNHCAAKKACNPCAAKKACNPCNPCAAKKGCGPCSPCNPCNPCGAGAVAELTAGEARKAYDCLIKDLAAGYTKSGLTVAGHYKDWKNYSNQPYVSDTHGGRYVNNYSNALAVSYNKYEEAGRMPVGALLAKDSFAANANGKIAPGPLFVMEKMPAGFNKDSGNWRYTMVLPNGQVFGTTNGAGSAKLNFCYECHMSVAEEQDSLMFLPDEYRVR
ncbi:MAG: hypothetical protein QF521_12890 [Alphaproteobacteria bacterium]|nr:hypothetical protein [Alphaproteobacteria bacterium]